MEYRYVKKTFNPTELEKELGLKHGEIAEFSRDLITGEVRIILSDKAQLLTDQLEKMDKIFPELKRIEKLSKE